MKTYQQYLILALSGAAAGLAFPPSHVGIVAFAAFIPLIVILEQIRDHKHPNLFLYVFFFCFHGAANWWVMSWQKETDPYLMAAGAGLWLGHPFFLMPAFWLYMFCRRRAGLTTALVCLPLFWIAVEWLHSLTDLSYPWLALGYTQTYNTILIQIADLGGVWMVSLVVMSVNAILAHWIVTRRRLRFHLASVAAVLLATMCYGAYRLTSEPLAYKTALQVGIVQPSIDPWVKWQGGIRDMIRFHQHLQDSLNVVHHCDLSVWSETAIPIGLGLEDNRSLLNSVHEWVDTSHTALLTGYADYEFFPAFNAPPNAQSLPNNPGMKVRLFNAAGLVAPGSAEFPTHHKSHLTPFGEYMPFSDDFPAVQSWLKWGVGISGWNKGAGATVLPYMRGADTIAKIGPVICIESIYPNYVADYVRRGADMLAVITNDAWYDGTFGPEQHYCISRMRAVETRREIMRCGNSGVSGYISSTGESVYQAEARKPLALHGAMHRLQSISMYVRFGDWLPQLSLLIVIGVVVRLRMRPKNSSAHDRSGQD